MKAVEVNIDKYELDQDDIKEAIADLMKKRGKGELTDMHPTQVHIAGDKNDLYDEGYYVTHYIVNVKR